MSVVDAGEGNTVRVGANVTLSGIVEGDRNLVHVGDSVNVSSLEIRISGNDNTVIIERPMSIKGLKIYCGNHVRANGVELAIDEGLSVEHGARFFLYNSANVLRVGRNCLFSNNLTVRCGESPHLIFDRSSGEYLDVSEGVFIGDHVWIGENVYLTKKASVADESIVAACSVVTKRFEEKHAVIAGNPARCVRRDVQWIKNHGHLEPGSIYAESHAKHLVSSSEAASVSPEAASVPRP